VEYQGPPKKKIEKVGEKKSLTVKPLPKHGKKSGETR
jgi:hypothetical protein